MTTPSNPNTGLRLVEAVLHYQPPDDVSRPVAARLTPSYLYPGVSLTAIHERTGLDVKAYDIYTHSVCAALDLADGESLTLIARYEGAIIACAVFEVSFAATDFGLLLLPRASANLLLHQIAVDKYRLAALDIAAASSQADDDDDNEEDHGHAAG